MDFRSLRKSVFNIILIKVGGQDYKKMDFRSLRKSVLKDQRNLHDHSSNIRIYLMGEFLDSSMDDLEL
jgi:hypothetical protein